MGAGYDEAFIDRIMPGLTMTIPLISGGCVQVAEQKPGEVIGVVVVTPSGLPGIARLYGLYVDPPHWKRGVGRALFSAAATRARTLKAGAMIIDAEPTAKGFYERMQAIQFGETPFAYSPEVTLPQFLYIVPPEEASAV